MKTTEMEATADPAVVALAVLSASCCNTVMIYIIGYQIEFLSVDHLTIL